MIKTLFTFGLLGTSAMAQTPSAAPPEDDDKVKCDFKINEAEVKCEWYQECYEQKVKGGEPADVLLEPFLNGCILKGNKVCERYDKLGTNGKVVANTVSQGGCHPSTTCCDGQCCTDQQECLPMERGTFSYGEFDKEKNPPQKYGNLEAEHVARNGWKLPGGEKGAGDSLQSRPMHCVDIQFDATTGGKAVFTPLMAMLLLLGSAIAGFRRNKIQGFFDKIAPAFIMLSGFFLMLTQGWVLALFTALVASATMATPRASFKGGWLVVGQLMFCWIYFGGLNLFFSQGTIPNYFRLATTKKMTELETSCQTFYDFYGFEASIKPWDVSDTRTTYGLCSREFISFQVIMSYVNAFALFTMTTHTFMEYLAPIATSAKNAQSVANPAASIDNA